MKSKSVLGIAHIDCWRGADCACNGNCCTYVPSTHHAAAVEVVVRAAKHVARVDRMELEFERAYDALIEAVGALELSTPPAAQRREPDNTDAGAMRAPSGGVDSNRESTSRIQGSP